MSAINEDTQDTSTQGDEPGTVTPPATEAAAPTGDTSTQGDELDYKAMFESEQKKTKALTSESIKRKNRIKEFEDQATEAQRKEMGEIDRLKAEKQDLIDRASSLKKDNFAKDLKFEAHKAQAKNKGYIEYLVNKKLESLDDEGKAAFELGSFIEGVKAEQPDQFGSDKPPPATPANTGSGSAGDTPPESPGGQAASIGRINTRAEAAALDAAWDEMDAKLI